MTEEFNTIVNFGEAEITEKKSRFIASVSPVSNEDEARAFIEQTKKKYWDARHNVFAFSVGTPQELLRQSDDGEPQGTAGLPVLQAITSLDLKNTVVVVTRYFGGTLLGTGGLVRAYGKAAKEGIIAAGIAKKVLYRKFIVTTDYTISGKLRYEIDEGGFILQDTIYTNQVDFVVLAQYKFGDMFIDKMTDAANGKLTISEQEPQYGTWVNGELL